MSSDDQQRTTMYLPADLLEEVRDRVGKRGVSKLVRELLEGWLEAPDAPPSSARVGAAPAATPTPPRGRASASASTAPRSARPTLWFCETHRITTLDDERCGLGPSGCTVTLVD